MRVVGALSELVNVREDALRLLLSILAGYPLAALHRTFFYNKPPKVQHYFFVITGVLLYLFNCGWPIIIILIREIKTQSSGLAIYHSLLSIGVAYLIINIIPGTALSVALAHICFFVSDFDAF
jgi:lysophospholipid acyltransferase 5